MDVLDAPVLEHVLLPVRREDAEAFEAAFARARRHLEAAPGFRGLHLARRLERDGYLLLVGWDSVEAHTRGFRGSSGYAEWSRLLHPFYDPFPVVEHAVAVATSDPGDRAPS